MTVSYFEALEANIPSVEARRKMDLAEATFYAHVSPESARKMWSGWSEAATRSVQRTAEAARARFTVNGEPTNARGLKRWMRSVLGGGARIE